MKIAAAGTGFIAKEVLPQLADWGWTVEAICSTPRSEEKAKALAEQCGGTARVYTDFSTMLDSETVDAVYLCVPNHLHHSFVKAALTKGVNVIVEKPIASNDREALELAELARSKQLFFYEAISTLYHPNFHKLRELLPLLGEIKLVSCNFSQYSSRYDRFLSGDIAPVFDPVQSGGALMDLNLYNLHYLIGLFGVPKSVGYQPNIQKGIDTSGVLTLDYGRFQAVSIAAKDCGAPCFYTIQGTKGYLFQSTPANTCGEILLHLNNGTEQRFDASTPSRLEPEFRHFLKEMAAGDLQSCYRTLEQSLDVCRVQTEARTGAGIYFPADIEY